MNAKIGFEARRRKIKEKKTMLISLYIFISYYTIIDKFTLSRQKYLLRARRIIFWIAGRAKVIETLNISVTW
jgi:hypothetical protein